MILQWRHFLQWLKREMILFRKHPVPHLGIVSAVSAVRSVENQSQEETRLLMCLKPGHEGLHCQTSFLTPKKVHVHARAS